MKNHLVASRGRETSQFINPRRLFHGVWLPQWLEERPEVSERAKKLRPEGGGAEGIVVLGVVYAGKQLGESAQENGPWQYERKATGQTQFLRRRHQRHHRQPKQAD